MNGDSSEESESDILPTDHHTTPTVGAIITISSRGMEPITPVNLSPGESMEHGSGEQGTGSRVQEGESEGSG